MKSPTEIQCPVCGDYRQFDEDGYAPCSCRKDWLYEARRIVAGEVMVYPDTELMRPLIAAMKRVDELEAVNGIQEG